MDGLKAALDASKQIITLSTGLIALTLTFLEKLVPAVNGVRVVPAPLKIAWISYGVAVAFALWTVLAITGSLNALDRQAKNLPLNDAQRAATENLADGPNVRVPAMLMLAAFALGLALTIASGFSL